MFHSLQDGVSTLDHDVSPTSAYLQPDALTTELWEDIKDKFAGYLKLFRIHVSKFRNYYYNQLPFFE